MSFPINSSSDPTIIASLPYSITDTFGGIALGETWFKYTGTALDILTGIHLDSATTVPSVEVFNEDLTAKQPEFGNDDEQIEQALDADEVIYLKVTGDVAGTASITLSMRAQPNVPPSGGSILVPDPADGAPADEAFVFPAVALTFDAEAVTAAVSFGQRIDHWDILDDGTIAAVYDTTTWHTIGIYSSNPLGQLLASIANPITPEEIKIRQDHAGAFYFAGRNVAHTAVVIYKLFTDGTVGPTTWTLPITTVSFKFAVNCGGTIAYYSDFTTTGAVKRWNLTTDATMSDLVAGVAGYKIVYLTVLADDSVIVSYKKDSDDSIRIMRYNSAGVSQATFNAAAGETLVGTTQPGADDPTSIVVRTESGPLLRSIFYRLASSDFSVLEGPFTLTNFDDGVSAEPTTEYFGPSEASDILVLRTVATPADPELEDVPIRWRIRSPHVSSTGNRIFHQKIQLDMQTGLATTNGTDRVVWMRTSNDGGNTWSDIRQGTVGELGQYGFRVQWFRNGMSRDRVYEFSGSGEAASGVIVQAWLTAIEGTN